MDPFTVGLGLVSLVPDLIKWFGGSDKSAAVIDKAISVAKTVTGKSTGEEALKELQVNPELVLAYRAKVLDNELEFQKLQRDNMKDVNTTMQAETKAEHWPSYSWRPYNGFLFGTTIFGCYFVLPLLKIAAPSIPEFVWITWGSILGIASYFRGKAQADPNIPLSQKG